MKIFHRLVFDDHLAGTTSAYTTPELNATLASASTLTIAGYASATSGTNPTLTVQVEEGPDEQRWSNRGLVAEIEATGLSTTDETTFIGNDGNPGVSARQGFARLRIQLGGTTSKARVRIWVTGRDLPELPTPASISGLVLWLRADLGITTVDSAISSPNDITNVIWNKSGATAASASTLREDTSTGFHYMYQNVTSYQKEHVGYFEVELKAGSRTWAQAQVCNESTAYINLSTGALGTTSGIGSWTITDVGGGWWRVRGTRPGGAFGNSQMYVLMATGNGGNSYTGDGASTIEIRAAAVEQKNVSAWADQSGQGDNATQGTAALQPVWELAGGPNRRPCITFDGGTAPTPSDHLIRTLSGGVDRDIFIVNKQALTRDHPLLAAGNSTSGWSTAYLLGGSVVYPTHFVSSVDQAKQSNAGTGSGTDWRIVEHVAIAGDDRIFKNGSNITGGTAGGGYGPGLQGIGIAATGGDTFQGSIAEIIFYNRLLTQTERDVVEAYLTARYGISVS